MNAEARFVGKSREGHEMAEGGWVDSMQISSFGSGGLNPRAKENVSIMIYRV